MKLYKKQIVARFLTLCMIISIIPNSYAAFATDDMNVPPEIIVLNDATGIDNTMSAAEAPSDVGKSTADDEVSQTTGEPAKEDAFGVTDTAEAPSDTEESTADDEVSQTTGEPAKEDAFGVTDTAEAPSDTEESTAGDEASRTTGEPVREDAFGVTDTAKAPSDEEFAVLSSATEEIREDALQRDDTGHVFATVTAYLEPGQIIRYSYTPSISTTYIFESVNVSGDAYGWLTNSSDDTLISNDDGGNANGNGRNFSFSYYLNAGTTYYFCARWYSSSSYGTMSCQLNRDDNVTPISADGRSYEVNIATAGERKFLSFSPSTTGTYVFESINASGDDTYGYLYDSSWSLLTTNDDSGDGANFRISYSLDAEKVYYFAVKWLSSSLTGKITVRLSPNRKILSQPTASSYVTNYEEISAPGEKRYFQFTPATSGTYILESTNSSGDPVVQLYHSNLSTELTSNDDGGSGRNFRLSYTMSAGTTYYYAVRFYGSSETGRIDVRLSLSVDIVPIVLSSDEVALKGYSTASINPSDTSNGAVSNGQGYFSFTPKTSGTYFFESTNSGSDPAVRLYNTLGGTVQASDDNSGNANSNSRNFRLSRQLTQNTTYYIAVRWVSGSGSINIRVRRDLNGLASTITVGSSATATINERGKVVYYRFTPSAGREYTFESTAYTSTDSSSFDPYVILYDADFNVITSNDDGGEGVNFRITQSLSAGASYYFAVKRLNDRSTGTVSVRLLGDPIVVINADTVQRNGAWTGSADITTAGSYVYFSFTPQISDTYIFESTNDSGDPYGELYSGDLGSGVRTSDDDGGNSGGNRSNFKISCSLNADQKYYYGVRYYYSSDTGTIRVRMLRGSEIISLDASAVEQNGSTTSSVTISTGSQIGYFSFTPQTSGSYVFESTNSSGDTYGYLYSGLPGSSPASSNDDSGSGQNFKLVSQLTAGTTYHYGAKWYSSSTTGTIYVKLGKETAVVEPTSVSVSLASSTIYVGNQTTATANVLPSNATDKSVTWSSDKTTVASVSNGVVTARAAGTARIIARTSNGITGSALITVVETPPPDRGFHTNYEYNFWNSAQDFNYPSDYRVPVERYMQLGYTQQQAQAIHDGINGAWYGNCFGMAVSSVLLYTGALQVQKYDTNANVTHDFAAPRTDSRKYAKLVQMIELIQESQIMPIGRYNQPKFNANAVTQELDRGNPVKFGIGGHAVVIYSYEKSGNTYTFHIYDNANFVDTLVYRSNSDYAFYKNGSRADSRWKPDNYCTADNLREVVNVVKTADNYGAANLLSVDNRNYIYILCPMVNMTITNSSGKTATITSHTLGGDFEDMDLRLVLPGYPMDSNAVWEDGTYRIVAPADAYRITGPGNITVVGVDMSIKVITGAETGITVSDDLHTVGMDTVDGQEYSVKYNVYNDYFDALTVHGVAGERVVTSLKDEVQDGDHVDVAGTKTIGAEATVNGKTVTAENPIGLVEKATQFSVCWPVREYGDGTQTTANLQIQHCQYDFGSDFVTIDALMPMKETAAGVDKPESDAADDFNGKGSELAARERTAEPTFGEWYAEGNNLYLPINKPDDDTIVYYYITGENDTELRTPSKTEDAFYTSPILVTRDMQIVAVAVKLGYEPSEVVKWKYSKAAADTVLYYGDLNGDGTVTIPEISKIIVARSRGNMSDVLKQAADLNGDGTVTIPEISKIIVARSKGQKIERRE